VGVADEGMADFEDVFGCQAVDVSKIENQGTMLKLKGNKQPGIIKRTVD
jgi:hypothetical protein